MGDEPWVVWGETWLLARASCCKREAAGTATWGPPEPGWFSPQALRHCEPWGRTRPTPHGRPLMSTSANEECQGWLNGTLDTYQDPSERAGRESASGGFTSQNRQDRLLFESLFRRLGRQGVYADVAANHFKRISNTYFYDVCLGWRGLCVEPNRIYWPELRSERSCTLIPWCASDSTAEVELLLPEKVRGSSWLGGLGGIGNGSIGKQLLRPDGTFRTRHSLSWYKPSQWHHERMRCVRLADEFARLQMTHVDFMSLDVEGHVSGRATQL
jgi:hypothetical protein